jgi:hypothetical protein
MASTSGKLEIFNMALGFVGTRTIGSPNEHTPEAIQCELMWDRARRSALRDFPYRFAVRRLRLPEKMMPEVYEQEWTHCYGVPDTVLKIVRVHDGTRRGMRKTPYAVQRGDEGEIILCDVGKAIVDAVVDVEDITIWDEAFVSAMARKLACLIAVPLLKHNSSKVQELAQLYQAAIPVAEGADASESYDRKLDDAWIAARGGW